MMKRISALILSLTLLVGLCGCLEKDTSSDVSSEVPSQDIADTSSVTDNGGLGLFDNVSVFVDSESQDFESAEETESIASEVVSSEETVSEEVESEETPPESDTESEETESEAEEPEVDEAGNTVKPSTINNPTGIESSGRSNNSGSGWEMTLVNPWNTLTTDYTTGLELLDSRFGEGKYFDARAIGHLEDMCEAAAEDGVNLWVISAHRTYDYQQMLFDAELAEYKSYNPDASDDEAIIGAASVVARPGTSEHNLGLAVDFNSVEQSFENTPQYKWLRQHSTEYGFIMRYAADKQDITGVIYEPWHYRYVGVDNAKKIENSGLCLEEYIKNN